MNILIKLIGLIPFIICTTLAVCFIGDSLPDCENIYQTIGLIITGATMVFMGFLFTVMLSVTLDS